MKRISMNFERYSRCFCNVQNASPERQNISLLVSKLFNISPEVTSYNTFAFVRGTTGESPFIAHPTISPWAK